jgi:hypothetical protein
MYTFTLCCAVYFTTAVWRPEYGEPRSEDRHALGPTIGFIDKSFRDSFELLLSCAAHVYALIGVHHNIVFTCIQQQVLSQAVLGVFVFSYIALLLLHCRFRRRPGDLLRGIACLLCTAMASHSLGAALEVSRSARAGTYLLFCTSPRAVTFINSVRTRNHL